MKVTRQTLTETSPASATSAAGTLVASDLERCSALTIIGELQGATGGTLDVFLQTSWDGGTTWYDYAHFTQLAAGAAAIKYAWHVSRASERTTITAVGSAAAGVIATGAIMAGGWGNQMRMAFTAGASTSAGAAQTVRIFGLQA
jgi:hypothetical protein